MTDQHWRPLILGQVCEKIGSGSTPLGGKDAYLDAGIPFIRSQNVYNDGFRYEGLAYISERQAEQVSGTPVREGDVLLTITGDSVARACQAPKELASARVSQHVAIIRPKEELLDKKFLRYYLTTPSMQEHMLALAAAGATRNALTKGMIEKFAIPAPLLKEQAAIGSILSSLDEKIGLNRQISESLDELGRSIFKAWFVNYDLPDLPPDEFEDSDIGKIPRDWSTGSLGEHLEILRGLSYSGPKLGSPGLPLHNLNSVLEGGGYKFGGIKYYKGEFRDRHLTTPGDIIVANTEQGHSCRLIGYPALVPKIFGQRGLFSHHLFRLRPLPTSGLGRSFFYFLLLNEDFRERLIGYASGTTVNMLPSEALRRSKFVVPPPELAELFERVTSPLLDREEACHSESDTLAQIRDLMLPKVFSGGLKV